MNSWSQDILLNNLSYLRCFFFNQHWNGYRSDIAHKKEKEGIQKKKFLIRLKISCIKEKKEGKKFYFGKKYETILEEIVFF